MKLEEIKNAQPGNVLWDKGSPASVNGLHLRVYGNGRKSFLYYYRNSMGQQRRPKIGDFPEMTLADARSASSRLALKVANGEDPRASLEKAKEEMTVQELFDLVLEKYWGQARFVASGRKKAAKWAYDLHFKDRWGKLRLSELTRKTIKAWSEQMVDKPYAANRAIEFLTTMFKYAEDNEIIEMGKNPCIRISAHGEKKRKRFATPGELRLLAEFLESKAETHLRHVVFIWMLLFSGSRPKFIEDATWPDLTTVEIEGQIYGILSLAGKSTADSGEDEVVILPPQAMRFVSRLPRTSGTITGIKLPRDLWYEAREYAGCIDLRARDLRRTFASVALSNQVGRDVIGELLNHRSSETTRIYARLMDQSRIEAAKKIADAVQGIITAEVKATTDESQINTK